MRLPRRWVHVSAWIGFLALLALHLDSWRPQRPRLWLGWIPEEIAWRLAWMALAGLYLAFFCSVVWRDDDAEDER